MAMKLIATLGCFALISDIRALAAETLRPVKYICNGLWAAKTRTDSAPRPAVPRQVSEYVYKDQETQLTASDKNNFSFKTRYVFGEVKIFDTLHLVGWKR